MGIWGTALFDDDIACDVKDFYIEQLQNGICAENAEQETLCYFSAELADMDDAPIVWLALAAVEWQYGRLSSNAKNKALHYIENGETLAQWYEIDETLGRKREQTLLLLKNRLLSPQPKEKKVRKPRTFHCTWQNGDVYAMQLHEDSAVNNGLSGYWMVMQKVNEADNLKNGVSPVVTIRITESRDCPTLDALKLPCVRINRYLGYKWSYRLHLLLYTKKSVSDFVYIGNYDLVLPKDEYPHENNTGYFISIRKFLEDNVIERYHEFGTEI